MLDIKLIRENPAAVENDLKKRRDEAKIKLLHELLKKDKERLELLKKTEELRYKRNVVTKEIAELKAKKKPTAARMKEIKEIPEKIRKNDAKLQQLNEQCRLILLQLPNILHDSVPVGNDDKDNVEIRRYGEAPKFDFAPKGHAELLSDLGLIDSERAAKVAGHGFFYMKNELVLLDMALQRFALDFLRKKGFVIVNPPYMISRKPYEGVTSLADFIDVLYKIEGEDLYLIATSEHSIAAMLMDETLLEQELPMKIAGVSPCFRKEVGAHGKYTKGLFRMHQFHKIEQFIFSAPEQSWQLHEELQQNSEALYQELELHHRVVSVCTGDIGMIAAKKYDTEVWMADGVFREAGSNSNCTDFQARRLNIKYREKEGAAPKGFVHTLNNTAIATSRTMMAIIEQFQQKDGSVLIPKALRPYTGFDKMEK